MYILAFILRHNVIFRCDGKMDTIIVVENVVEVHNYTLTCSFGTDKVNTLDIVEHDHKTLSGRPRYE